MTCYFCPSAFNILCFWLSSLIIICLGVDLILYVKFIILRFVELLGCGDSHLLSNWGSFQPFIFSNILSAPSSLSSLSGTPIIMYMLACLMVSHRPLKLYIDLYYYCLFFTCSTYSLFLPYFKLIAHF